jgi:hypothetical protein
MWTRRVSKSASCSCLRTRLICGAALGEAERGEVEGNGETDQESAEGIVKICMVESEVFPQDGHDAAGEEAEVSGGEEAAALGSELSSFEKHGGFSFLKFNL